MLSKLIKFSAVWCGQCKSYAPIFEEVAKEFPNIEFASIDVDEDSDNLVDKYNVKSLPTTVKVYEDGTFLAKSGRLTKVQLKEFISDAESS